MDGVILDRISKEQWFLSVAMDCALRSTCLRRKYGAIIVDENNYIISTGYNGAPRGVIDCLELKSCWREAMNIPSGQNYEKCMSVHAEMNALLQAGKSAKRGIMYLAGYDVKLENIPDNMIPCSLCTKLLINSQVSNVIMTIGDIHKSPYSCLRMTPYEIWRIREKEILS